jgi:hypothetical protein
MPTVDREGGGYTYHEDARSISPFYVEHAIIGGSKDWTREHGESRTVHRLGDLEVVTTRDNNIVITIGYRHSG